MADKSDVIAAAIILGAAGVGGYLLYKKGVFGTAGFTETVTVLSAVDQSPIEGALVSIGGTPMTTGPGGQAVFPGLSGGSYTITVSGAQGYQANSKQVSISSNDSETILLTPVSSGGGGGTGGGGTGGGVCASAPSPVVTIPAGSTGQTYSAGETVPYTAYGLTPGGSYRIDILIQGNPIYVGADTADSMGNVSNGGFVLGHDVPVGVQTLRITDLTCGTSGTTTFNVGSPSAAPATGTFTVVVTDKSGAPLPGALVNIAGGSPSLPYSANMMTGLDGTAVFSGPLVYVGFYTVSVSKSGYISASGQGTLTAAGTSVTVQLAEQMLAGKLSLAVSVSGTTVQITGTDLYGDGSPVASDEIDIYLLVNGAPEFIGSTGVTSSGAFSLTEQNFTPGAWQLYGVSKVTGAKSGTAAFTVSAPTTVATTIQTAFLVYSAYAQVAGAYVTVYGGPVTVSGQTNTSGKLVLQIPPGTYTLKVNAAGFTAFSEQITVSATSNSFQVYLS